MTLAQQTPAVTPRARVLRRNRRYTSLVYLLGARVKELQREPEIAFWVFAFPLLLALGLGVAFRNRPADVTSIAIVAGPGAENTVSLIEHSPQKAAIRARLVDPSEALLGFRMGKFDLVVQSDGQGGIEYRYDPTRPESVLSRAEVNDALQSAAGSKPAIPTSSVTSSEPGSRYIDFLIPGLLGMNQMNSAMWGIGFALVEMRQRKLLKRFVATPMRRSDFLLALTASRLLMMTVQMVLLLAFGVLLFHMRILGSLLTIFLITVIGSVAFGGLGLLAACRAQKIETASGIINLVMMPMWIFSGVFFSYERFPAMLQPFIKALPLTALNDALRDTILQGSSLASQSERMLLLLLWGGISFALSLRWFRWT